MKKPKKCRHYWRARHNSYWGKHCDPCCWSGAQSGINAYTLLYTLLTPKEN